MTRRLVICLVASGVMIAAACQPIRGTLPRGLRPAVLMQVETATDGAAIVRLRSGSSGWRNAAAIETDLNAAGADHHLVAFDIDNNGSVELVGVTAAGDSSAVRAVQVQPPTGGLVVERLVPLPGPGPNQLITAIDVDGDAFTDLVSLRVAGTASGVVEWSSATAASGFTSGPSGSVAVPADGTWRHATALDATGDCRSDLALAQHGETPRVTVFDGASAFTRPIADAGPDLGPSPGTRQIISPDDDFGGPPALWILDTDASGATSLRTLSAATGFATPTAAFTLPDRLVGGQYAAPSNPPLGGAVESIPVVGRDQIVDVAGIAVHRCIADNLRGLLAEARRSGFALSGTGWRSTAQQAVLRRRACGARAATAPTEACRPPTAPVGLSMHERGLAVDFRWNGRSITSRSSPAYRWLAANAARFGFRNYPLEPWHWSTNGE